MLVVHAVLEESDQVVDPCRLCLVLLHLSHQSIVIVLQLAFVVLHFLLILLDSLVHVVVVIVLKSLVVIIVVAFVVLVLVVLVFVLDVVHALFFPSRRVVVEAHFEVDAFAFVGWLQVEGFV